MHVGARLQHMHGDYTLICKNRNKNSCKALHVGADLHPIETVTLICKNRNKNSCKAHVGADLQPRLHPIETLTLICKHRNKNSCLCMWHGPDVEYQENRSYTCLNHAGILLACGCGIKILNMHAVHGMSSCCFAAF